MVLSYAELLVHFVLLCVANCTFAAPAVQQAFDLQDSLETYPIPDLSDASISQLQASLQARQTTSLQLVQAYKSRIAEVNSYTRSVLEINPYAESEAKAADKRRAHLIPGGLLEGIPILIKDNIAQVGRDGVNTTAGSFALLGTVPSGDAFVVRRLKAAGAIILGKANMCEWANGRGNVTFGWSARGGQTLSPYYDGGNPCGSSSGSAVATSLGLAAASLGTETGWSITCPSHRNNVIGVKPTTGLTSRHLVVPLITSRDTIGPITRTVEDAALLLQAIAGKDPNDAGTLPQPPIPDYMTNLRRDALRGARIGVLRLNMSSDALLPDVTERLQWAASVIDDLGANVTNPVSPSEDSAQRWEEFLDSTSVLVVGSHEIKVDIESYLATLSYNPENITKLEDVIAFNREHAAQELPESYTDQSTFIRAAATDGIQNTTYLAAVQDVKDTIRTHGLEQLMDAHHVDAFVTVLDEGSPASYTGLGNLPIVTVPLGFHANTTSPKPAGSGTVYPAPNMPFGLMFVGRKWSEQKLLGYAYAFEQATKVREQGKEAIIHQAKPNTTLADVLHGS